MTSGNERGMIDCARIVNGGKLALLILLLLSEATGRAQSTLARQGVAASAVKSLNRTLVSLVSRSPGDSQVTEILAARRAAIEKAIREDPASVGALALDDAAMSGIPAADLKMIETAGEWSGTLEALVQDDFARSRSQSLWRLQSGGRTAEIFFPKDHAGRGVHPGTQIRVTGIRSGSLIAVDTLVSAAEAAPPQCSTTGNQKIATIMVTTPSNPAFPVGWNTGTVAAMFAGNNLSLDTYWHAASYGATGATVQAFGPFALLSDYTCDQYTDLLTAALQAAGSSVDFSQFDRVTVFFPVQGCTYGGLGTIGCFSAISPAAPSNQLISVAWLPVFPFQVPSLYIGILAHEEGHNLGLGHANTEDFGAVPLGLPDDPGINTEYGDPFSVMGNANQSLSGLAIVGDYSAQHKSLVLNWLKEPAYQQVRGSGTFALQPFEGQLGGTRALRVLRNPLSNSWLWLEYRTASGAADSTLAYISYARPTDIFDGALVHYENPGLDSLHTYLADLNATAAPNNFYNSALHPGQSWSDPYSLLTIQAFSPVSGSLPITVTYDEPCASLQPSASFFQPGGGAGFITVSAPPDCAWTAVTRTSWLTLTGALSGQGDGVVNFLLAATSTTSVRTGYVSLQRQAVPILQAGAGVSAVNSAPYSGTGVTGVARPFTFTFNDVNGFADISQVDVKFAGPSGDCVVLYLPRNGGIGLADDAGLHAIGPVFSGQLSNSRCAVAAAGTTSTGSGNQLQITVQVSFTPAFAGTHGIYVQVFGSVAGRSDVVASGTWIVDATPAIDAGGVVPNDSTATTIQPGSWISIFGNNLAAAPEVWNSDFPITLGGTSVLIDGRRAYLWYVSPTQINVQAPDDLSTGIAIVRVTTPGGIAVSSVTLGRTAPSFSLLDGTHAAAIILRADGSGTYGGGAYDIAGPTGTSLGYKTVAAKAGDVLELFGVGFGPTDPAVPAGQPYSGSAATVNPVQLSINNIAVTPSFAGLTAAGLYQMNVVQLPSGLGSGDVPLVATVAGVQTQTGVVISLQ